MMIGFFFDPSHPPEAEMAQRCWDFYLQQGQSVNKEGLTHILNTRSGELVVLGAARHFDPNQQFTRSDLALAIGEDDARVFSWIRQLGRPEKKFGMKVFDHHPGGSYSLSPAMHEAIITLSDTSTHSQGETDDTPSAST